MKSRTALMKKIFVLLAVLMFLIGGCAIKDPIYTLNILVEGAGRVEPEVGSYDHPKDTVVDLEAIADFGWSFVEWEGDVLLKESEQTSVIMDQDKTVTAIFVADIVNFVDENLEQEIRKVIEKPTGDILIIDLQDIIDLDVKDKGIASLAGIEFLFNLEAFNFSQNEVTDVSPLCDLIKLKNLVFSYNDVNDISPLKNLVNLERLYFPQNKIDCIADLANLINLEWLSIINNGLSDISSLAVLTNLQVLYAQNNDIDDIFPLVNNPGLGLDDFVNLKWNKLDLTPGSQNMLDIQALIARGVNVEYEPQK